MWCDLCFERGLRHKDTGRQILTHRTFLSRWRCWRWVLAACSAFVRCGGNNNLHRRTALARNRARRRSAAVASTLGWVIYWTSISDEPVKWMCIVVMWRKFAALDCHDRSDHSQSYSAMYVWGRRGKEAVMTIWLLLFYVYSRIELSCRFLNFYFRADHTLSLQNIDGYELSTVDCFASDPFYCWETRSRESVLSQDMSRRTVLIVVSFMSINAFCAIAHHFILKLPFKFSIRL